MAKRYLFLLIIFLFRCVLGLYEVRYYTNGCELKVKGEIVKVFQKDTKCIVSIGRFLVETDGICASSKGILITAVGTIDRRLIDNFLGRLTLVSGKIDNTGENAKTQKSENQKRGWVDNFREELVLVYKRFVPEPEAGLIAGIVLGYKKDIGREFYQEMIKSGSVHIAVASGYNVLLVGGVVLSLCFWFLKRKTATLVAIGVMVFYSVLAGGEPPVIRAVWMASFIYMAQVIGRASVSSWILCLTALIMFVIEPPLFIDPSFQLSVAASLGMIVLEPRITSKLKLLIEEKWVDRIVGLGITTTISTMITTAPVLWFQFGRMSLIGILSNILILPLVPPLMLLGSIMLVFPYFLSGPVYALAHLLVVIIKMFGQ